MYMCIAHMNLQEQCTKKRQLSDEALRSIKKLAMWLFGNKHELWVPVPSPAHRMCVTVYSCTCGTLLVLDLRKEGLGNSKCTGHVPLVGIPCAHRT